MLIQTQCASRYSGLCKVLVLSLLFAVSSCQASDAEIQAEKVGDSLAKSGSETASSDALADIQPKDIELIQKQLVCHKPATPAANTGCSIVKEFISATRPDDSVLKEKTPIKGQRWLGITVNTAKPAAEREEYTRPYPYINLVILARQHSDNFHEKIYFPNGMSATYIWPTREQEVKLIEDAAEKLQNQIVDTKNPAVAFAETVEHEFEPLQQSAATSVLLGNPNRFLRQSGDTLYLIEKEELEGSGINYLLSRVSLKNTFQALHTPVSTNFHHTRIALWNIPYQPDR